MGGDTLVVVPCFNEAQRLAVAEFQRFAAAGDGARLLFVDDGSTDETSGVLAKIQQLAPERFAVLSLPQNRGKAEAVRQGIRRALAGPAQYVGYWDADLSTPLEAIAELRAVLGERPEIEMVFGARVKLLGRSIERRAARHYAGRLFATLASTMLGLAVYDTQCGAKLFRVNESLRAIFSEPFVSGWIFDVEVLARLIQERRGGDGLPPERVVYEYPLRQWHHVEGSKIGLRDLPGILGDLIRIYRRYLSPSGLVGGDSAGAR